MSEPTLFTCLRSCGAPVAAGGPAGHCPVCLLERICDEEDEVKSSGTNRGRVSAAMTCSKKSGRGGIGVVYRARQRDLGRIVAVKVLLDAGFASDAQKERFRREAEAVGETDAPRDRLDP